MIGLIATIKKGSKMKLKKILIGLALLSLVLITACSEEKEKCFNVIAEKFCLSRNATLGYTLGLDTGVFVCYYPTERIYDKEYRYFTDNEKQYCNNK